MKFHKHVATLVFYTDDTGRKDHPRDWEWSELLDDLVVDVAVLDLGTVDEISSDEMEVQANDSGEEPVLPVWVVSFTNDSTGGFDWCMEENQVFDLARSWLTDGNKVNVFKTCVPAYFIDQKRFTEVTEWIASQDEDKLL